VIGLSGIFAAALKRDAGVTLLAERRLAKPEIVCSHSFGDRFRRSRIGRTFLAPDPPFARLHLTTGPVQQFQNNTLDGPLIRPPGPPQPNSTDPSSPLMVRDGRVYSFQVYGTCIIRTCIIQLIHLAARPLPRCSLFQKPHGNIGDRHMTDHHTCSMHRLTHRRFEYPSESCLPVGRQASPESFRLFNRTAQS